MAHSGVRWKGKAQRMDLPMREEGEKVEEQEMEENRIDLAVLEKMLHPEPSEAAVVNVEVNPVEEDPVEEVPERKEMKAKIVDIPFAALEASEVRAVSGAAGRVAGCRHEKSNGRRCGRAVWQEGMCGVHGEWHQTIAAALGLPFPGGPA